MEMNNIESTHGSKYNTAGLHRKKYPGVGNFTPYHASEMTITHAIRAGVNSLSRMASNGYQPFPVHK